jgi:hypothetical protein
MKSAIVVEVPLGSQHFFRIVCGWPAGLFDAENFGKLFFSDGSCREFNIPGSRNSNRIECRNAQSMRSEANKGITNPCFATRRQKSRIPLRWCFALRIQGGRPIPFREQL